MSPSVAWSGARFRAAESVAELLTKEEKGRVVESPAVEISLCDFSREWSSRREAHEAVKASRRPRRQVLFPACHARGRVLDVVAVLLEVRAFQVAGGELIQLVLSLELHVFVSLPQAVRDPVVQLRRRVIHRD